MTVGLASGALTWSPTAAHVPSVSVTVALTNDSGQAKKTFTIPVVIPQPDGGPPDSSLPDQTMCNCDGPPPPPDVGPPDKALPDGFGMKCGDGICVNQKEFCDTCPKDCGKCTGCAVKKYPGCKGCKCEKEVCKMQPSCCTSSWGLSCVQLCKFGSVGCGITPDSGPDLLVKQSDQATDQVSPKPDQTKVADTVPSAEGKTGDIVAADSADTSTDTGAGSEPGERGCSCEVGSGMPGGLSLVLLIVLAYCRRRRSWLHQGS